MSETCFLVDNNARLALGRDLRNTEFYRARCYITEDVAREAGDPRGGGAHNLVEVTPIVLHKLRDIMHTLPPGDTDLVDLYANKGMADPVLVATAMVLQEKDEETLFPRQWVIATADRAVARLAEKNNIGCITPTSLKTLVVDASAETTPPTA